MSISMLILFAGVIDVLVVWCCCGVFFGCFRVVSGVFVELFGGSWSILGDLELF